MAGGSNKRPPWMGGAGRGNQPPSPQAPQASSTSATSANTPTPNAPPTKQAPPAAPPQGHDRDHEWRRFERFLDRLDHRNRHAGYGTTSSRVPITPGTGKNGLLDYPDDPKQCEGELDADCIVLQVDYDIDDSMIEDHSNQTIEDAYIEVLWGAVRHHVEVDLVRGFQLDLTGPRIIVNAIYPKVTAAEGDPAIMQPTIIVRASLGIGSSKSNPGITGSSRRTVRYGTVGNAMGGVRSAILPIPRWATSVVFQSSDNLTGMLRFQQFANVTGNVILSDLDLGKLDGASAPIVQGATHAAFFNPGLADVVNVRAIYYLAI